MTKGKTMAKEVKKIVDKVLDRKIEDKKVIFSIENAVNHNSAIGSGDIRPILQQIGQSLTGAGRVGDRIRPKYLRVRGMVSLSNTYGGTQVVPIRVRIIAFKQNDIKVGSASTSVDTSSLLRAVGGGGTAQAFSGNVQDLLLPVFDDKFSVLFDRQVTLTPALRGGPSSEPWTGHHYAYSFRVKCPAQLKYDVATGDWANNFAPFMAVGYAYPSGSSPDVLNLLITHTATSELTYEDA